MKRLKQYINRYTKWVIGYSKKQDAEKALAGFSFAESSIFPIPIDPLLAAMVSLKPEKTVRFVHIAAITSILGALLGYFIGAVLMDTVGDWLVRSFDIQDGFMRLGESYANNAFLAVLAAAFTPIPYKIITISAGAFSIALAPFVFASIIGRYARYSLVGWFSRIVGVRYRDKIEYFINLLSLAVLALIILVVIAVTSS